MKSRLILRQNRQNDVFWYVLNDEKRKNKLQIFCKALTKKIISDIINMKMLGSCICFQLYVHLFKAVRANCKV